MTTAAALRAARDGCDCPPWIDRCVHVDEKTLLLSSASQFPYRGCPLCQASGSAFTVALIVGKRLLCEFCNTPFWFVGNELAYSEHEQLEAALAAFYETEEQLLAGEL